ncbi:hypothetical protein [Hymenobacter sp. GOD-10R]|uniref:hypothetical protein n=1 Tax=Hymenobacter sp. GOD-10R TaxID=3093922 RepID=UPI002D7A30DC|nr:hypothetical protein [Hymenobacter sp. GOD-10R]WRQ28852.1 hypothetical protein SD425_01055 [Hymenobacter sp. GOD-10R]
MLASLKATFLLGAILLTTAARAQQTNPPVAKTLVVSPLVGEVVDAEEKSKYGLFPYYNADNFQEARFVQFTSNDSTSSAITLQTTLRNGDVKMRSFTTNEFENVRRQIETRDQELKRYSKQMQNVTGGDSIGSTYSVELLSGNSFIGVLLARRDNELDFSTKDLGRVTIQKSNIQRLQLLSGAQISRGWEPLGNGTRIFFAPTARTLRKGEGYVQDIDIFFLGANYGITDNISVGALIPLLPGVGLNAFALTPKVGFPVSEKLHVGGGVLYANIFGSSGGLGYGLGTYGTADNNLTLGLGYGFASGDLSSSPIVVVGGATRISRRISLLDETYIFDGGFAGLFGLRVAATRLSGSLGFLYGTGVGGIYPVYAEVAYRFGKAR